MSIAKHFMMLNSSMDHKLASLWASKYHSAVLPFMQLFNTLSACQMILLMRCWLGEWRKSSATTDSVLRVCSVGSRPRPLAVRMRLCSTR